jgi:hypothetical protein
LKLGPLIVSYSQGGKEVDTGMSNLDTVERALKKVVILH